MRHPSLLPIRSFEVCSVQLFPYVIDACWPPRHVLSPLPQLFTTPMFRNIGIHWGVAVPGFLALLCLPFPFVFYKYGAPIRERCKWTRKSEEAMKQMMQKKDGEPEKPTSESAAEQDGDQTSSVRRSQSERTLAEADEVQRGSTQKNSTR